MPGESGQVAQKGFCKRHFTRPIYPLMMRLSVMKQTILQALFFFLLFTYLIIFDSAIWEWIKPDTAKEGSQKLILVIFGISDLKERLIKIITKIG